MVLQWLLGYPLSVAAWVGFIACFGMATSTGIIMLVYLRQAVERAAVQGQLTSDRLRTAVLDGAAQRIRPKLLTEATTLLGLAPLLLATGTGSDVLRPMIVPVLGGLLIADEVIDLLLPVLFYRVRLRRLAKPGCTRGSLATPQELFEDDESLHGIELYVGLAIRFEDDLTTKLRFGRCSGLGFDLHHSVGLLVR